MPSRGDRPIGGGHAAASCRVGHEIESRRPASGPRRSGPSLLATFGRHRPDRPATLRSGKTFEDLGASPNPDPPQRCRHGSPRRAPQGLPALRPGVWTVYVCPTRKSADSEPPGFQQAQISGRSRGYRASKLGRATHSRRWDRRAGPSVAAPDSSTPHQEEP